MSYTANAQLDLSLRIFFEQRCVRLKRTMFLFIIINITNITITKKSKYIRIKSQSDKYDENIKKKD